ncbi:MAG: PIN domain-containing protein [Actinomycetota bacterium]|nr:PIN domain-containing protein [Actinomycetota bacterium]
MAPIGATHRRGESELYTTAIALAENRFGVECLAEGRRKVLLRTTADEVFGNFAEHVLPFDARAALRYAAIVSGRDRVGRPIDGFDAQIASICREHRATLATRNGADFGHTGIHVIDPWQGEPRVPRDEAG